MANNANKIRIPAITERDYDLLCGALRQLRIRSLRSWSLKRGFSPSTTYMVVRGHRRKGVESKDIIAALKKTVYAKDE